MKNSASLKDEEAKDLSLTFRSQQIPPAIDRAVE
jgi:hypothetical protein